MTRFRGIEGLRAWLAWAVVASHVGIYSGLTSALPHVRVLPLLAQWAVLIFIIISGFVITHLILSAHEHYGVYITRRFLRLYPTYVVCFVLALLVMRLNYVALGSNPWGPNHVFTPGGAWLEFQEISRRLSLRVVLSALLLQGAIPDSVLPQSADGILNPAWTLSLEWQFYLVAPVLVWLCARHRWGIVMSAVCISFGLFYRGTFGSYALPSVLPLALPYFLIGITTRFFLDRIPQISRFPTPLVVGVFVLFYLTDPGVFPALAVWMGMVAYLKCNKAAFAAPTRALRFVDWALESRWANAAGERSYSVYLFHWVALGAMLYVAVNMMGLSSWPMAIVVGSGTILATLVGSELIYRCIERPGIRLGKRLARKSRLEIHIPVGAGQAENQKPI